MGNYAKNLRTRADILGSQKTGFCVICGAHGKLTNDHVPPKGCIELEDVILQSLMPTEMQTGRASIIQGGVRFKTLCEQCNNNLLGIQYDPALKNFVNAVLDQIKQRQGRIALSPIVRINCKPNRIARSLIGHIFAAHSVKETIEKIESLGAGESLRKYLLNPAAEFPFDWRLYCWPYFSRKQVIIRHAGFGDFSAPEPAKSLLYGHIIKFFPLGFWFVHNQPPECHIHTYEVTPIGSANLDIDESLVFDFRSMPAVGFPEHPVGNQIMLMSDEQGSVASPRKP
jgi:hypothetical protein